MRLFGAERGILDISKTHQRLFRLKVSYPEYQLIFFGSEYPQTMWKIGEWPAKSQGGRNAIFEDVAGNVESFRSNVQQMFIKGDAIDIDACFATSSGVF